MSKRDVGNYVPYIRYNMELNYCITDEVVFMNELQAYLILKLNPDLPEDISINIEQDEEDD